MPTKKETTLFLGFFNFSWYFLVFFLVFLQRNEKDAKEATARCAGHVLHEYGQCASESRDDFFGGTKSVGFWGGFVWFLSVFVGLFHVLFFLDKIFFKSELVVIFLALKLFLCYFAEVFVGFL